MNDHNTDHLEEIDPPDWALEAMSTPSEKMEDHVPPTDPNISVVAGSEAVSPSPAPAVKVATETVVDQVAHFMERFVFLKAKSTYKLLALWVVATHMCSDFEYMGYIFACSPEPQSGKSRLLEVLDLLIANPSGLLVSPTEAVLFRTAEGHTQLLDEVDGWSNREVLRSVLNAGFHKGANVKRMQETVSGHDVRSFPVFAPRALAGIGDKILDPTTRDRTFMLEMVRQTQEERREKFRAKTAKSRAEQLKTEIVKWVAQNRQRVSEEYERSEFGYLQDFRDRTIDITEPLAAIMEIVYEGSPKIEQAKADLVEAVSLTRKDHAAPKEDHRILQALIECAQTQDPVIGNATELATSCGMLLGVPPEALDVSGVLRRYGFETKSIRIDGESRYRYSLPLDRLSEIWLRYGSSNGSKEGSPANESSSAFGEPSTSSDSCGKETVR